MLRAKIKPELLRWARERAGFEQKHLAAKFKKLPEWEAENRAELPTMKQAEAFAKTVHVPFGYLFFDKPPKESMPIPDFRTIAGKALSRPSPDLLDTIYSCQERQNWYRNFVRAERQPERVFINSATLATKPEKVAAKMRDFLDFGVHSRQKNNSFSATRKLFVKHIEDAGVLVMINGIVGNNTHRKLNPEEFRGFALSDPHAPLIFVNGADTQAAQIFTLAHEFAHLWLGASALSSGEVWLRSGSREEEIWCNATAAEFLVPLHDFSDKLRKDEPLPITLSRLARFFKVSTLVILRRLLDARVLPRSKFQKEWKQECARLSKLLENKPDGSGGTFYDTTLLRVGRNFARAVTTSALEGRTLYRDAYRMLGLSKTKTFDTLCAKLRSQNDNLPA